MKRGLWFVAGAGTAVYMMVRGRRAAEVFTVDGLQDRVGALSVGMRIFRDEVAQGQAEKESELRDRLGLVPHGTPELTGGRHKAGSTGSTGSTNETNQEGSN
jgi:hypothetical protein